MDKNIDLKNRLNMIQSASVLGKKDYDAKLPTIQEQKFVYVNIVDATLLYNQPKKLAEKASSVYSPNATIQI